jgi:4-hydroxy-4-methyl-2-oxoglutarate aldolase
VDAIVEQFLNLPTTCISDAMDGLNNLDSAIKPLKEEYRVAGRVLTVKMPVGDNLAVLKAMRQAQPGDVLVVDAKGDIYRGMAGDFVVGMMQTLGIAGLVVDGAVRDVIGVKQVNLPVFCRGIAVAASGKAGVGEVNVAIACGGVTIQPGDIVVGDADGVVVIPRQREEEILKKAQDKLVKDQQREAKITGNREAILKYLDDMINK